MLAVVRGLSKPIQVIVMNERLAVGAAAAPPLPAGVTTVEDVIAGVDPATIKYDSFCDDSDTVSTVRQTNVSIDSDCLTHMHT